MYYLKALDIRLLDFLKEEFESSAAIIINENVLQRFNKYLRDTNISMRQLEESLDVLYLYGLLNQQNGPRYQVRPSTAK
jgi:DNA-binding HxlR family transcriptional regulator